MGFLDSLTDAFTGAPAKEAAAKTQAYLSGVGSSNTGVINAGRDNAVGAIQGGAVAGRDALSTGYGAGVDATNAGYDAAGNALTGGYNAGNSYYDQAAGAYKPLSDLATKYGGATTLGLNALGVNGAAGTDAARDAFKAGPAYEFNLDQGIEAINRRRNMGGMLDSGNADRDAQVFGAGQASNEYDKWLGNLLGFTNPELAATQGAASGVAGVRGQQAGAANAFGVNMAGNDTGRAAMLADLAKNYGNTSANLEATAGNNLAGVYQGAAGQQVGQSTALAKPYADTYGQEAAAQQQGSANLWNLGINAGKLAAGGLGSKAGGGAAGAIPSIGNFNARPALA